MRICSWSKMFAMTGLMTLCLLGWGILPASAEAQNCSEEQPYADRVIEFIPGKDTNPDFDDPSKNGC